MSFSHGKKKKSKKYIHTKSKLFCVSLEERKATQKQNKSVKIISKCL